MTEGMIQDHFFNEPLQIATVLLPDLLKPNASTDQTRQGERAKGAVAGSINFIKIAHEVQGTDSSQCPGYRLLLDPFHPDGPSR